MPIMLSEGSWSGLKSSRGHGIRGNRRLEHTCLAETDEILLIDDIFAVNYQKAAILIPIGELARGWLLDV